MIVEATHLGPLASYIACMAFFLTGVIFGAWWYPDSALRRRLSKPEEAPPRAELPVIVLATRQVEQLPIRAGTHHKIEVRQ